MVNGRLTAVASCSIGGGEAGQACPDDDAKGTAARWPAQLDAEATRNEAPPVPPAPLLDADVGEIDQGWLAACLGDAAYPPR